MVQFDPDAKIFPPALEALFARPAEMVPAVLVIAGPAARRDGWAARAMVSIATMWAERGAQIVLADLCLEEPELHETLGETNSDGLADVFEFGSSVRWMARYLPERGFRFLPTGAYIPDPVEVLRHPRWDRLIDQFAEDQTTLLAYAPAGAPGLDAIVRRITTIIVLADSMDYADLPVILPDVRPELVLVRASVTADQHPGDDHASAGAQSVAGEDLVPSSASAPVPSISPSDLAESEELEDPTLIEPSFVLRKPRKRRLVSPVLVVALLLALGGGGWYYGPELLQRFGIVEPEPEPNAEELAPPSLPEGKPVDSPVPFSVAIEAHPDFDTALGRIDHLRGAEPVVGFYLAPIARDSLVYHWVFAGPVADTASAMALMRRLVDGGHKTEVDPWAVRPTAWAYHLGDFPSQESAAARAAELLAAGVPTYIVEIEYTSGSIGYRLYAGAFEGPAQAEIMAQILKDAGIEAPLIHRQGKPVA